MRTRQLVIWTIALGFLVWLPTGANAQNRSLSGKHKMFCCNNTPPLQIFQQPAAGAPPLYWTLYYTGMGLSKAAAQQAAGGLVKLPITLVTETGMNGTLLIGYGQIAAQTTNTMATPNTPKFVSLSTVLDWKVASATLAKGGSWPAGAQFNGGESTWSFCPGVGPGTPMGDGCSAASLAGATIHTSGSGTTFTYSGYRNGRVVRKAGVNKFGGTMSLLGGNVTNLKRFAITPVIPIYLVGSNVIRNTPIGGKAGTDMGAAYVSNATSVWPLAVGPLTTHTPGSNTVTFYAPNPATLEFYGAGPWGTGYAGVQITQNQQPPLTKISWGLQGYDDRNATGYGNLQLVSGVLYNGLNVKGSVTLGNRLTLTLPEPAPALGVVAGALALAGLGWTRARRRR